MWKSKRANKLVTSITFWILILIFAFPVLWFVLTSFKSRVDAFSFPPKLFFSPTLANYHSLIQDGNFLSYYSNSLKIGIFSTLASLLIGIPAAYALSRFRTKKSDDISFWILSTRMAPPIMVILPLYLAFRKLQLLDTFIGMIILYILLGISFVVWMMKSYFESVPIALEEAARIDGCSRLGAFCRITLPLSIPGIISSSIFTFIIAWNEFLFALIMTGEKTKTVTVAITSYISFEGVKWGEIAAAGTLVILPVLVFGILIQKYFIKGLTMGSVK